MLAIIGVLLCLVLNYLAIETVLHAVNRRAIPTRVHVNGTRGKSSVTRLIAAGLRAGGVRVVAKTTGTTPRLIDETGAEEPIRRMGPANLIEQAEVFSWARRRRADAIIIECMAVNPKLQEVAERHFVRSTVGVITNARPDHLDVMGPTVSDVARSLCATVPRGGVLFTAEHDPALLAIMHSSCEKRRTRCADVTVPGDTDSLLAGFRHIEHADNVALALAVCQHLGVPPDVALAGMRSAEPDPGALCISSRTIDGHHLRFVNALAANDPVSTLTIWERVIDRAAALENAERRIVFLNTRSDRQHRSLQLAELMAGLPADAYVVTGGGATAAVRRAREQGVPDHRLVNLGSATVDTALTALCAHAGERALVFALGNVGGIGLELAACFQEPGNVL
jgi:poly-gamma-glutamate synthase PgsB/CapB